MGDRAGGGKPIPLWAALSVMGGILAGGGFLSYMYLYRPPTPPNAITVVTPAPGQPGVARTGGGDGPAGGRGPNPLLVANEANLPDGIHALATGGTMVKAGDAYMKVFARPDGTEPGYSFGFFTVSDAQWEHGYLSLGVRRLIADDEFARSLGVTAEQRKKLGALPAEPPRLWPAGDRERFVGMYKEWQSAAGPAKASAGEALVKDLNAYASAKRSADQAAMSRRVAAIRASLTAAQAAALNPIPRWEAPGAPTGSGGSATRPTQ